MTDIIYPGDPVTGVLGQAELPTNVDIVLWRGDYFKTTVQFTNPDTTPMDLTGYTAQASFRTSFGTGTPAATLQCTISSNVVTIELLSVDSEALTAGPYIWDFQLTDPSGNVRTYLAGDVTVYDEVTH